MRFAVLALSLMMAFVPLSDIRAQEGEALSFLTVERRPFAFDQGGEASGFSIELMRLISEQIGQDVRFEFVDEFPQMLEGVLNGEADGAVANISITSEREAVLDFSLPIYDGGLQILVSGAATGVSIWSVIFRWEVLTLVLVGFGALFILGLLMWVFERRHEGYFKMDGREAMFPSFWWALNLVLNGGFEVNMPRSILGRLLGVFMVVSSLFVVSIFVANITAALTVEAIAGSIQSLDDLPGRRVGTTQGSTASLFLEEREVEHETFASFSALMDAFEAHELDAVIFDGPILAFYMADSAPGDAQLLDRVFRSEDYGIALPQGSDLREPINRALLRLSENGQYRALRREWFGEVE
ncbi:transporter substrate-binding domain-containing protein [Rhodobacterales bacterium HKCCE4037]|nr:transporter substrate-binding domain-containing protein [Rhodobacterales bacterium HKCCE4037]